MSLKSIGTLQLVLGEIQKSGVATAASIDLMTLSLKGLSEEQIATIVSASGLTAAQIKSSLSAAGASEAIILEKLAMMGFSKEAAIAAVVSDTFSKEQAEAAASTMIFTGAATTATGATMKLSSAFSAFGMILKAHPILFIATALLALLPVIKKIHDHFTVTAEEAAEAMKGAAEEVKSLTTEFESLRNELETTQKRIEELEKLAEDGRLTPDQTAELEDLRATNDELERKITLNEKLSEQENKEADEAAVTSYEKNRYDVITAPDVSYDNFASYGKHTGVEALRLYMEAIQNVKQQQDELNESFAKGSISEDDYNRQLSELQGEYDYLSSEAAKVARDQKDVSDSISGTSEEAKNLKKSIDDVLFAYSMFDANTADKFKRLIGLNEYNTVVDRLEKLGKEGKVTENVLSRGFFADFVEQANSIDISTQDIIAYFNAFQNESEDAANKVKTLTNSVADYQAKVESVYAAKGNVDLLNRRVIDIDSSNIGVVQKYTPDVHGGEPMTVLSKTYQDGDTAIVVTPILPNGQILSEEELTKYVNKVIAATKKAKDGDYAAQDNKGIILNVFGDHTTFERNNEEAEVFAQRVHEIHEAMIEAKSDAELDELVSELSKLTEYNPSMAALAEKFADVEDKFDNLGKGLKEFKDEGKISLQTLSKIGADFGDNREAFDQFAKTLLDSSSTMEEAKSAANALASEYLNSADALDLLTAGNRKEVETLLEGLGVTNAAEVVESRLLGMRMQAKAESLGLADSIWSVTEARLRETGATDEEIAALQVYRQTTLNAIVAGQDFAKTTASETGELIRLAQAAGASAKSVQTLIRIQQLQRQHDSGKGAIPHFYDQLALLQKQYSEEFEKNLADTKITLPEVTIPEPKSSGGSSSKSESEFERLYKYHQHLLNMEQESVSDYLNWLDAAYQAAYKKGEIELDDFYKYQEEVFEGLKTMLDETIADYEHGLFLNEKDVNRPAEQVVETYRKMQEEVHALAVKYREMGLAENSDLIQELQKQWWGYQDEIDAAIIGEYEKIRTQHENAMAFNQRWMERAITIGDYSGVWNQTDKIIEHYRVMQEEVHKQADYYRSLGYEETSDEISKLSSLWWEYYDEIRDVSANAWSQIVDNTNDALDAITGVYDTLRDAATEYNENGYITVDTLQKILDWGVEYLDYLKDEEGQLVINEEAIQNVIKARTEQMAVETALQYVESLRTATLNNDTEALNRLLFATRQTSTATWELVDAQLQALNLNDEQYGAARQHINDIYSLTQAAIVSVGKIDGELKKSLEKSKDALDDILKYVEAMIKQEVETQVDALEKQVKAYKEIVDLQKKALDTERKRDNYSKSVAEKVKELGELQAKIALADLDTSRNGQAEKAKLLEQYNDLQEELADTQADYAYDATADALDDMYDAYEKEKNKEIEKLKDTVSSEEKLYRLAIQRIDSQWDTLYQDLIDWNTQYGSDTNKKLTEAWNNASSAVQQYGSYLSAVEQIQARINSMDSSSNEHIVPTTVAPSATAPTSDQTNTSVRDKVAQMRENTANWHGSTKEQQSKLQKANENLAAQIGKDLGQNVTLRDGWWYLEDGRKLYDVFPKFHSGTSSVGGDPTAEQKEIFARVQKGEMILPDKEQGAVYRVLDFAETIFAKLGGKGIFKAAVNSDMSAERMQEQINGNTNSVQNTVDNYRNEVRINVPVQIYPAQKLDEGEIKQLSRRIGNDTIATINESYFKRGKRFTRTPLKPD